MAFTFNETKYTSILARLTALEEHHNNIVVAVDRLATIDQVQELLVVLQTDLSSIQTTLTALEARITAIENEPLT